MTLPAEADQGAATSSANRAARHEERIKRLLFAEPFQPFEVIVSTGVRYSAPHPFSIAIGQRSMAPLYRPKGAGTTFPKDQIVDVVVISGPGA